MHVAVSSGVEISRSHSSHQDVCDELQGRAFGFRDRYCEEVRTYHTIGDMMDIFKSEQQYWDEQSSQPWSAMLSNYPKALDLSDEDKSRFFQSGTDDAKYVMELSCKYGVKPPEMGTVLDFGCGMGRVAQGFVDQGFKKVLC